jgi:glycyl-tRNA synthetase
VCPECGVYYMQSHWLPFPPPAGLGAGADTGGGSGPSTTTHRLTEEDGGVAYLRPETAQGVYVQFGNVVTAMRARLPFGE